MNKRATAKKAQLVVRFALSPEDDQFWCLPPASAACQLSAQEAAQLSQKTPAVVLLDARGLRLDWLDLPPGVKPQEAGLLLEDKLSQPLEAVDVLPLQKQGRRLQTVTLDKGRALEWQQRAQELGLRVERWLPEQLAFAGQGEDSLIEEQGLVWRYSAEKDELLVLPLAVYQQAYQVDASPPVSSQALPEGALVPFLASHLPVKLNLWRASRLLKWLQPVRQFKPLFVQHFSVVLPWMLVLVVLLGQALVPRFAGQDAVSDQTELQHLSEALMGEVLPLPSLYQQAERRLELMETHRQWQEARLEAWVELQALLAQHSHLKLQALNLNEAGVSARLQGVRPADQARLRQVAGRWSFSEGLADWEVSL